MFVYFVQGEVFLLPGVSFDREEADVPRNNDGDAVYSFGVVASDGGTPVQVAFTTVSYHGNRGWANDYY